MSKIDYEEFRRVVAAAIDANQITIPQLKEHTDPQGPHLRLQAARDDEDRMIKLLNRLLNHRNIVNCDRDIYLRRWFVIRRENLALFIHKFERSDEDRALHDHPWNFIVIIVRGGYIEHYNAQCRYCRGFEVMTRNCSVCNNTRLISATRHIKPGSIAYHSANYRHRVELIDGKPSWSLFIRFRKLRDWGFWMPSGFIQWQQWWKENCE